MKFIPGKLYKLRDDLRSEGTYRELKRIMGLCQNMFYMYLEQTDDNMYLTRPDYGETYKFLSLDGKVVRVNTQVLKSLATQLLRDSGEIPSVNRLFVRIDPDSIEQEHLKTVELSINVLDNG